MMSVTSLILVLYSYLINAGCLSLTIPVDARNAGIGRFTGVALFESPAAMAYNPAAIGFKDGFSSYTTNLMTGGLINPLIPAVTSDSIRRVPSWFANDTTSRNEMLGFTYKLPFKGDFVLGVQQQTFYVGQFIAFNDTINPNDRIFEIGLAKRLRPYLSLGIGFKHILQTFLSEAMAETLCGSKACAHAKDYAFDFGLAFKSDYGVALGLAVQNIGPDIKYYSGSKAPLPRLLRIGAAFRLDKSYDKLMKSSIGQFFEILFNYEYQQDLVKGPPVKWYMGGTEIGFLKTIYIRFGNVHVSDTLEDFNYGTKGLGIKLGAVDVDVAENWIKPNPNHHLLVGKYWVSVSLHYPYKRFPYTNPDFNEAVGVMDALLVPGGGHIYHGNPRGIAYLVATAGLMHKYLSTNDKTYRGLAAGVYVFSLFDFFFNLSNWHL